VQVPFPAERIFSNAFSSEPFSYTMSSNQLLLLLLLLLLLVHG
jgi:hypothetical protein